jgi:hypothetical protein
MQPARTPNKTSGWVWIGDRRVYCRSLWEKRYTFYLEFLKAHGVIRDWRKEKITFWFKGIRRGVCSYLPDFEVTNLNGSVEFHEVKGYLDKRSQTKHRRMAKYYPQVKLVVIGADWFRRNGRQLRNLVPGWTSAPRAKDLPCPPAAVPSSLCQTRGPG